MVQVSVAIDGKIESTKISEDTYECLQDGALLRNKPLEEILARIVNEYGALTEANILEYMDEKWVI